MTKIYLIILTLLFSLSANAQIGKPCGPNKKVKIYEYNLNNGLHVILLRDTTSPIVHLGVAYNVGSRNERPDRTGFAHLTEHLMFHGSKNIPENEYDGYIASVGGYSNAYTSYDYTNYYQILPANQVNLGLWLESERMLHPRITEDGLRREIEVVKEESRQRYDGSPMGRLDHEMMAFIFEKYPYRWPIIGSMDHLNAASLEDFMSFFNTYYVPNNACLYIAGDFDLNETKNNIEKYFGTIPASKSKIERPVYNERTANENDILEVSKEGIKKPHLFISYMAPPENTRESDILKCVINILDDTDSKLNISEEIVNEDRFNKLEKKEKDSLMNLLPISRITISPEFYQAVGMVWVRASFNDSLGYKTALDKIDSYFNKVANEGVNEYELQKLKKQYENDYIDVYFEPASFADMASLLYVQLGSIDRMFTQLESVKSITNDEIKSTVKKYLNKDNRKIMVVHKKEESK